MSTSAVPELGSNVVLVRQEIVDGKRVPVEYPAIVFGFERGADHDPAVDGQPHLTLVFATPKNILEVGGADFGEAFERLFSIPHEDVNAMGHMFWKFDGEVDSA